MSSVQAEGFEERRNDVRLAGRGPVEVVRVDDAEQPVEVLRDAAVLNVSAGGVALVSKTPVGVGSRLRLHATPSAVAQLPSPKVQFEALECSDYGGAMHKIRCRLTEGRVPAGLIYGW